MKPRHTNQSGNHQLCPHPTKLVCTTSIAELATRPILTTGAFDILHAEHLRYLLSAAELDREAPLVVVLDTDDFVRHQKGGSRPIVHFNARALVLSYLDFVDHIVPNTGDRLSLLRRLRPSIYVMSLATKEAQPEDRSEELRLAASLGARVVIFPVDNQIGLTTTTIVERARVGSAS